MAHGWAASSYRGRRMEALRASWPGVPLLVAERILEHVLQAVVADRWPAPCDPVMLHGIDWSTDADLMPQARFNTFCRGRSASLLFTFALGTPFRTTCLLVDHWMAQWGLRLKTKPDARLAAMWLEERGLPAPAKRQKP